MANDENDQVWIVTWNGYVHGVFGAERVAQDYARWRWPGEPRYGVKIEPHGLNTGWDPTGGGRSRVFHSAEVCNCEEPYIGTQKAGEPLRCERCRLLITPRVES